MSSLVMSRIISDSLSCPVLSGLVKPCPVVSGHVLPQITDLSHQMSLFYHLKGEPPEASNPTIP